MATSKQIENGNDPDSDWAQGYGYQMWRCRHNAVRGDGMYGQFCIIHKETDTVLAMTAVTSDMQGEMNVYYDEVLLKYQDEPCLLYTSVPGSPRNFQSGVWKQQSCG